MAKEIVLCDTDVIIDYWNNYSPRHSSTKDIIENSIGLNNIILSAITQIELLMGAHNKDELSRINKKISQFQITFIDNNISETAIEFVKNYRLSHSLALADAFIAATAKVLEVALFTYNLKDYKFIDQLNLYLPAVS